MFRYRSVADFRATAAPADKPYLIGYFKVIFAPNDPHLAVRSIYCTFYFEATLRDRRC